MAHDVFVSYPSEDKPTADAVVAALESHGLRCWYAPRDVEPGADWAGAIVHAIGAGRLTVLVFSEAANASEHILREVRQAADGGRPILPFRISPEDPSESLRYYIGGTHWLDALSEPLEEHLDALVETTQRILEGAPPDDSAAAPRAEGAASRPTRSTPSPRRGRRSIMLAVAGGAVVLAILAIVAVVVLGGGTNQSTSSESDEIDDTGASIDAGTGGAGAGDEWRPVSFNTTDRQVWAESGERFTALEQEQVDAFAWSTEIVEGDFTLRLRVESPGTEAAACVIVYGGGQPFHTYGSLIFCLQWDFFYLEKHTTYHSGENFVTYAPSDLTFPGNVYDVEIDIDGDVATLSVNGAKVLSTVFDPEEIDLRGRIGLHKKQWIAPEVTFSNVELRVPADGEGAGDEREEALRADEGFDCALDTGADLNHFPVSSRYITHAVEMDGVITSPDEWADAMCVDLRMHYTINLDNPNFQQGRWWVQHDADNIYFLARIPAELGFNTAFADYFWPEFVGTWEHSDGIAISSDGTVSDHGQWDENAFYQDVDMDPPGTFDTGAAFTEDADFVWIEMQHPLDSGDGYDWPFELGGTYGNNPYDSFLVGVDATEGTFLRYLQLTILEP